MSQNINRIEESIENLKKDTQYEIQYFETNEFMTNSIQKENYLSILGEKIPKYYQIQEHGDEIVEEQDTIVQ